MRSWESCAARAAGREGVGGPIGVGVAGVRFSGPCNRHVEIANRLISAGFSGSFGFRARRPAAGHQIARGPAQIWRCGTSISRVRNFINQTRSPQSEIGELALG